MDIVKC